MMRTLPVLALVLLLCGACTRFVSHPGGRPPDGLLLELPEGRGLRVEGVARGPLHGFGSQLRFRALISPRADARIDVFYELDGPQHDVLLWTHDSILRFDRRKGGVQELGDGRLELAGARLHLAEVALLALGRWIDPDAVAAWRARGDRHRVELGGVEAELWGPDRRGRVRKAELRWQQEGHTRRLTAHVQAWQSGLAGDLPRLLQLGGYGIRGRAQIELDAQIVDLDELLDFDPLRDR